MEKKQVHYVFDSLTKTKLRTYLSHQKARVSAERLNQQYGSVRYVARIKTI